MITGVHALIYTRDAEADRAFFRDVLEWPHVDAHGGWLIFAMPPAEIGVHPLEAGGEEAHELHLMCDDVAATVKALKAKGVKFAAPVKDMGYGRVTAIRLPGGGTLGLYEPRHASPLGLTGKSAGARGGAKKKPAAKKPSPAKKSGKKPSPAKKSGEKKVAARRR